MLPMHAQCTVVAARGSMHGALHKLMGGLDDGRLQPYSLHSIGLPLNITEHSACEMYMY